MSIPLYNFVFSASCLSRYQYILPLSMVLFNVLASGPLWNHENICVTIDIGLCSSHIYLCISLHISYICKIICKYVYQGLYTCVCIQGLFKMMQRCLFLCLCGIMYICVDICKYLCICICMYCYLKDAQTPVSLQDYPCPPSTSFSISNSLRMKYRFLH